MKEPGWPFGNRPPARLLWELWKSGRIMSCELNEHPQGWEIRYYVRSDFQSSQVFEGVARAETEAHDRKAKRAESKGKLAKRAAASVDGNE